MKKFKRIEHSNVQINTFIIQTNSLTHAYNILGDPIINKREYYIDELFNKETPIPQWAYDE